MPSFDPAELTDAIARGRLALAEVAAIPPREIDSLYALAVQYLDSGRDQEASELLAGLVALFPYRARTWRAYAIALHRMLDLPRALAAYEAALTLDPADPRTCCYRAEVLFYLGERQAALAELHTLTRASDAQIARRALDLILLIERPTDWMPPQRPPAPSPPASRFCLHDQRPLPLANSRFASEPAAILDEESTATAKLFAPIAEKTGTDTARVVRRRAPSAAPATHDRDTTHTAIVLRRLNAPLDLEADGNAET
ncbi:MAG: hypothetical protein HYZ27_09085 [Deltaproteobacteria bacterium]|nr:hypothetical protein [Deltaproteobacteria bacterium]